ncbi:energy transducer TonB [Chelativorans alearense]|uniref:energy transducer TonB n=1 Tax=Chelativorans alearense TaxID=2681495 RepID=UPI0013D4F505|nr:energy transducer TonB [Chelativorans alearense]
MIALPDTAHTREITEAEPVGAPLPAALRTDAAPSPPVEPHASPAPDTAPALRAAAPPLYLSAKRARALSLGLVVALGLSAAVHAAVLAYLGERVAREGVEAADDAISVEIILEAPPAPPARPVEGEVAETPRPEMAAAAEPPAEETAPTTTETASTADGEPRQAAEETRPTETPERQAEASKATPPEPTETAPEATSTLALPREDIPVPTPRPEPRVKAEARTKPAPEKPPRSRAMPPAKPVAKKAPAQAPAVSAGRTGGATAGEKAAYARRLLNHVERHKRYPSKAARQGAAGAATLSITIDRQGRLAGARLARGSGHAILDEEALAVARRAAPYPRPPEGIGGSTISFSVTLRFKR